MDFFYFLVTSSKAWEPIYHKNFFITEDGFFWGVIWALIIGVVCACAFYFGCCCSKTSAKSANIGVWTVFMIVAAALSYFTADLVFIGDSGTTDNTSVFRAHSFYKANDDYYIKETSKPGVSETVINDLTKKKTEIKSNLDKGGDVRFEYDLTTALLSVLFFFITSMAVKRFTITGKSIPFQNP